MKVRFLYACGIPGQDWSAGDVDDLPQELAEHYCRLAKAEPYVEPETAPRPVLPKPQPKQPAQ